MRIAPRIAALLLFVSIPATAAAQAGRGLSSPTGEPAARPAETPRETPPTMAPVGPPEGTPSERETPPAEATDAPPMDEFREPGAAPAEPGPGEPIPATETDGERMRALVIDAATYGIDPVVGRVATARMRATAAEMGYEVLPPDQTVAAAQQLRMPYPPTPADLWRVSWVARVHRGAFARIWAHAGQYVIEVTVASLDGSGPFFARGTAGADSLREEVDRLLRSAMPPPNVWTGEAAQAGVGAPTPTGSEAGAVTGPQPGDAAIAVPDEDTEEGEAEETPAEPEPELRRWSLTIQTEAVIGAADPVFYNHLAGARLDFRITPTIMLGVYAAYANLNARNGRADNILMMLQFENRIRISPDIDLTIPLRGAVGYLPFNGPVIRLAAGLNYALSPDWEIGIDLITPTFWILPDRTAVSLDVAIEATLRF